MQKHENHFNSWVFFSTHGYNFRCEFVRNYFFSHDISCINRWEMTNLVFMKLTFLLTDVIQKELKTHKRLSLLMKLKTVTLILIAFHFYCCHKKSFQQKKNMKQYFHNFNLNICTLPYFVKFYTNIFFKQMRFNEHNIYIKDMTNISHANAHSCD